MARTNGNIRARRLVPRLCNRDFNPEGAAAQTPTPMLTRGCTAV